MMRDDEKITKIMDQLLDSYIPMGQSFARNGNFLTPEVRKFAGLEKNPLIVRLLFPLFIKRLVRKNFDRFAKEWG